MKIKNISKVLFFALLLFVSYTGIAYPVKNDSDPIKITSLVAKYVPENKSVNIHWVTAGEKEKVQYIIERSLDSIHFRMIGETTSKHSSKGNQHYYFYDSKPVGGVIYYRILEVAPKGKEFVTEVVRVNTPISGMELTQLILAHNGKELNFAIISPDSSRSNVLVSDVFGHIKSSYKIVLKRGANLRSIYTGNLSPGVYFLQVNEKDGGKSVMKKFIKKAVIKKVTDSLKQKHFSTSSE